MPSIPIDGGKLVYTAAGSPDAPPLLLVHGWTSYRGVWEQTVAELQSAFYCISLDLPGSGDSDPPANGDYCLTAQAGHVLALADALHLDTFTLIGHSMGGQISSLIAGKLAPQRVTRLVSVAGVVTGKLGTYVRSVIYPGVYLAVQFPLLYRLAASLVHQPAYAHISFASWFHRMDDLPFDSWAADRQRAVQPGGSLATYRAGQAIKQGNLVDILPCIHIPALVIHGVQDRTVPVSDAVLFQQRVPDSQMVLLQECGHFPMYEKFSDYLRVLKVFLGMNHPALRDAWNGQKST